MISGLVGAKPSKLPASPLRSRLVESIKASERILDLTPRASKVSMDSTTKPPPHFETPQGAAKRLFIDATPIQTNVKLADLVDLSDLSTLRRLYRLSRAYPVVKLNDKESQSIWSDFLRLLNSLLTVPLILIV